MKRSDYEDALEKVRYAIATLNDTFDDNMDEGFSEEVLGIIGQLEALEKELHTKLKNWI